MLRGDVYLEESDDRICRSILGGMPQKLQRSQIFVSEFAPKQRY